MKTLLQYLADLAKDPVAQEAFKKDPEAAIAASDLSDDDKAILRTRNNGLIQAKVGQQGVQAMIYAGAAPMIYAQPPMIYAHGCAPMIYAHGCVPMIYAPMIYSPPAAPMIYAPMIYGHAPAPGAAMIYSHAPAPMIYSHAPAMIYASQPSMIYSHAPAMIYAPHWSDMAGGNPPASPGSTSPGGSDKQGERK